MDDQDEVVRESENDGTRHTYREKEGRVIQNRVAVTHSTYTRREQSDASPRLIPTQRIFRITHTGERAREENKFEDL